MLDQKIENELHLTRETRNLTDNIGTTVHEMMDAIVDRYFQVDCAIFTPNPERLDHIQEMAALSWISGGRTARPLPCLTAAG